MNSCDHWRDCGVDRGGCCGVGRYGGRPSLGVCGICPANTRRGEWPGALVQVAVDPRVPLERWPRWAKLLALMAEREDVGVGDTVHRVIGPFGEGWQEYQRWRGRSCSACAARWRQWNTLYPYAAAPAGKVFPRTPS
jgi:hypothetical protein